MQLMLYFIELAPIVYLIDTVLTVSVVIIVAGMPSLEFQYNQCVGIDNIEYIAHHTIAAQARLHHLHRRTCRSNRFGVHTSATIACQFEFQQQQRV